MSRHKKRQSNPIFKTLIFLALAAAVVAFYFTVDFTELTDRFRGMNYEPTVEMLSLKQDLQLTEKANIIFSASHPTLETSDSFNASCSSTNHEISVLGCYAGSRIHVYNVDNSELDGIKQSTLAHEILHAAWDRLPTSDQDQLSKELQAIYDDYYDSLAPRLNLYPENNFYDELHSIVGTEFADLSDYLETHYAKYFIDQDHVVTFYDNYDHKFQALKQQADIIYETIEINQELIDAKTANYEDAVTELNSAIADFNRRASSGYFTSTTAFNAERNTLVAQQENLQSLYYEIHALVDSTNQLIEQYNQNVARTQSLLTSINSNAPPATEVEIR